MPQVLAVEQPGEPALLDAQAQARESAKGHILRVRRAPRRAAAESRARTVSLGVFLGRRVIDKIGLSKGATVSEIEGEEEEVG